MPTQTSSIVFFDDDDDKERKRYNAWRHPLCVKQKLDKFDLKISQNGLPPSVIWSYSSCDPPTTIVDDWMGHMESDDQRDLFHHHHHNQNHYYYHRRHCHQYCNSSSAKSLNRLKQICKERKNTMDSKRRLQCSLLARILSLCFIILLGCVMVEARHYIAPGPCTWTHLSPPLSSLSLSSSPSSSSSISRDIRFKSSTLSSSSPSSSSLLMNELSHQHPHQSQSMFGTSSAYSSTLSNEFDVSLRCSVPILTPYTLNLSLIDPQHTVRLSIQCYGSNEVNDPLLLSSTQQRSTLRLGSSYQSMMSPFEHLRVLQTLDIENCLLDRLPTDTFRGLSSLKNLTIKRTSPTLESADNNSYDRLLENVASLIVEPYSFRHVESTLEHLDLSQNRIESLPNDLFCPFLTLHTLNLSYNHLMNLASFGLIDPATGRLCLQELYYLDLSNNHLEFVPETSGVAALKNLQHLNLSSNHISEITELAFSALRRLHALDLSGNRLRTLPGRMFRDSEELRELHLSKNGLIELPNGIFQGLSKLQVLDVGGNQITSDMLTAETFADLIRVIVLDLSNNRLHRLMASTFQNQYSLQVLSLEGNELETIDEGAFATLYNLHTLKLSGNRFRHLPESVLTGLFVLNELTLADNQLEHIHEDAFQNCTNLQILNLSSNRLTTIPLALHSLNKLQQLDLSSNKFTTLIDSGPLIDSAIIKLDLSNNYLVNVSRTALRPISKTLQQLYLNGNRLRQFGKDTFVDLKQTLRVLRLDRNEFSDITTTLANVKQLERLKVLNISYNHIERFDYALISNGLQVLDLSHNRIETLGNYYEREAQLRLEELDVSNNQLKEVTANSIPNSIRVLNLQQNLIEKIDQFTFVAKHNVTYVDLRNNSLKRIDNNAFRLGVQRPTTGYFLSGTIPTNPQAYLALGSKFQDGKHLPPPIFFISGNPYFCDCTMEWLQRVNQLVGGVTGSGTISTYPRIGDLDQVECDLPFSRQASLLSSSLSSASSSSPSSSSSLEIISTSTSTTVVPSIGTNHQSGTINRIPLLLANSSNFLCRYRSHCFALCHCCEFDACDCEMMCPENCTCYYDQTWNTNIVDCSGGHYRQVPLRIPMDVTSLYLDGNHLQSLNAHTFIGRKNLRILHLNHSMVETIANRSFNGLVYLEELHLQYNLLTALYGYEFESLHYLTTLNLDHNRLTFINDKTFYSLRSLQWLRLDYNHLTTFGQWFSIDSSSILIAHHHHQNKLQLNLGENPWSCQCSSLSLIYETLWQLRQRVSLIDGPDVRCHNGTSLFTTINTNHMIDQCNLTRQYYSLLNTVVPIDTNNVQTQSSMSTPVPTPEFRPSTTQSFPLYPQNSNNFDSIYHQIRNNRPLQLPPIAANEDENDPDMTYQPIDSLGGLRPKLLPPTPSQNHTQNWPGLHFSSSSSSSSMSLNSSNWLWIILASSIILVLAIVIFLTIHHKQDIQLWFYGRYGIRLFESGFCFRNSDGGGSSSGSVSSSRSRRRNGRNGFNDNYVRDSEKLFDAFVIYAQQDEPFVAQQLAAELECGYPPYRLCLRYRDLPAPTNTDNLDTSTGTLSIKDHGYAFDAVTQVIECSRRTLVVISEQFLQSEWCKFELKAAHQETLTSCKTHRLIVVVVPPNSQMAPTTMSTASQSSIIQNNNNNSGSNNNNNNNNNFSSAKQAESLLQRLDSETKTCIRGVTILTWQERRFWEKLRFAMPASSTIGAGSGSSSGVIGSGSGVIGTGTNHRQSHGSNAPVVCDSMKGRTSTVVVTNCGYPTLAPSSLSSSSSLARSSVLYDSTTTQPIYYQQQQQQQSPQHHYHYAQLPSINNQSTISLHKLGKQQQQPQSPVIRNPFCTKPLPPPPNQPLPPLPLSSTAAVASFLGGSGSNLSYNHLQSPVHHQQSSLTIPSTVNNNNSNHEPVALPPPYAEYTNQQSTNITIEQHHPDHYGDQAESSCMTPQSGHHHSHSHLQHQLHHQTMNVHHRNPSHYHPHRQQSYFTAHRSPRGPV